MRPLPLLAHEAGGKTVRNIDASLAGSGTGAPADEVVVVGGHYDSVRGAPGANDNGTGVAATLELARLLKDTQPARSDAVCRSGSSHPFPTHI